ncbi:MAG: hypothetical protein A3K30_03940 [Deltaproteobacteria bacterium RBG_13_51_10]|nr:MAG: hypothetical protein A3K30_03940 [Deltaproteobacteria bacterium RBG_13_51_10]
MKKMVLGLVLLMILAVVSLASAQTVNVWYPVEKAQWKIMAWDAPLLTDGDPLPDPADAALSYNIYVKNANTQAVILIGTGITALQQEIVLPKRARYFAGVEANLLYTGETVPMKSPIAWSTDSVVCKDGQTFGLRFQTGPKEPKELR